MSGDLQAIQARIKSLRTSLHTTHAMRLEAAAKLKRTQKVTLLGHPYQQEMQQLLSRLIAQKNHYFATQKTRKKIVNPSNELMALIQGRPIRRIGIVVLSSNRGLAANYNSLILNDLKVQRSLLSERGYEVLLLPVGAKALRFVRRQKWPCLSISGFADLPTMAEAERMSLELQELYRAGKIDAVMFLLQRFYSGGKQICETVPFLPLEFTQLTGPEANTLLNEEQSDLIDRWSKAVREERESQTDNPEGDPVFECEFDSDFWGILEYVLIRYLSGLVFRLQIESKASEQIFRMRAMTKASDNAEEMLKELQIRYNQSRQSRITQEIIEIISGAQNREICAEE